MATFRRLLSLTAEMQTLGKHSRKGRRRRGAERGRALGRGLVRGGLSQSRARGYNVGPARGGGLGRKARPGGRAESREPCCRRVEGGTLQAGPCLCVLAAGAWAPQLHAPQPESAPFAVTIKTHDFARAGAKGKKVGKQNVLTTARARVPGGTVGPGVGSRSLGAASTFPVRSHSPTPTLMCRDEPDTMILTRKMDSCRVGLV